MAHLVILGGPLALQRIPVDAPTLTLGRAPQADVALPDRKASAAHCRIERGSAGLELFDLESQNGTWVNGRRVRRHQLQAGDVIRVGTTELRFEEPAETPARSRRRSLSAMRRKELLDAWAQFVRTASAEERAEAAACLRERAAELASSLEGPEAQRLRRLVAWIRRLTDERDTDRLLAMMLDGVVDLTGAERGFLMLLDARGEARIRVARDFDLAALRKPTFKVARAVAERVARGGAPVVSTRADEDPQILAYGNTGALALRSVACVPIRAGERALGALYLDNRFERGVLRPEDLPFLLSFADQAAVALENARLHAEAHAARAEVEELNRILRGRVETQERALQEVTTLYAHAAADARTKYSYDAIVGESPVMRELFFLLDRVTDSDVPVFLRGESGTGKELAARAIHFNGPRGEGPFISENCAAIPETLFESELFGYVRGAFTGAAADKKGLFELARGGTLFLDEVGELPLGMQAKLLRVLQEHEVRPVGGKRSVTVDVRIVTASNRDLAELVRQGAFREDLYHRIHVLEVEIPPLRRRKEDIPRLVEHFLERHARRHGEATPRAASAEALALLQTYDWPGNVRELENEILRAVTLGGREIGPGDLSGTVREAVRASAGRWPEQSLKEAVRASARRVEREFITQALRAEGGNKSAAARRLGISRPTLDAKMEMLKIPRHPA